MPAVCLLACFHLHQWTFQQLGSTPHHVGFGNGLLAAHQLFTHPLLTAAYCLQAFQQHVQYELAGQKTGQLLLLVIANTTHIRSYVADQVPFNQSSGNSADYGGQRYRRYLEMQAAVCDSWVCPADSPHAAGGLTAAAGVGEGYVVLDAAEAKAAMALAAANGGSNRFDADSTASMHAAGCLYYQSFVLQDIKWALQAQSVYGIARTLFLVCLLATGAMLIHRDTYRLVLQPVQRMVERVREMAEDPLMLAAVTIQAPRARNLTSAPGNADASFTAKGAAGAPFVAGNQKAAGYGQHANHSWRPSWMQGTDSSQLSAAAGRPSKIRFWPAVKVHAVGDGDGTADAPASQPSAADGVRVSTTQLVFSRAQRLSTNVVAGMSAAGHAAARLGSQLLQHASAVRQLVSSGGSTIMGSAESEDEAQQGQYETKLLEQSIYKICALLAVGFGDAGAEVIAENIKKEGDLNPIVPGKKTVAEHCRPLAHSRRSGHGLAYCRSGSSNSRGRHYMTVY
eukprot:GHRR01032430.1.p1 GENE.GHRR01032430.1~~GHRR01032430.1.p1  ORF type:complete len:567 (+),score=192.97 GHRR01032430.1:174-1703(+)